MPTEPLAPATTALIRDRLHTAVLGDVLDVLGFRTQFLPQSVRPLLRGVRLVGRAMTVVEEDTTDPTTEFGLTFRALDQLGPGEVYLAAGGSGDYAMWGELMSRTARARGAVGAVVLGPMRDTPAVRALEFPVFSSGSYAQDQRGRGQVVGYRTTLDAGGVLVNDGDVLVGDEDGVLVIPQAHLDEVLVRAIAKLRIEDEIGTHLASGAASQAMFDRFGVM